MISAIVRAGSDGEIARELEGIYGAVAGAITVRGPVCWASGACCNFEGAGHRLYVTGLEAAYALAHMESQKRPTPGAIADARARGGCPFQIANLCGIHTIKPLGCRVYFCDRTAQQWQQDLCEGALAKIRELHERRAIPYVYAEWRSVLEALTGAPGDAPAGAASAALGPMPEAGPTRDGGATVELTVSARRPSERN